MGLNTLDWICTAKKVPTENVQTRFDTNKRVFLEHITSHGSVSSAKIFVRTDAGSKEFTISTLSEIDEQTKELKEGAKSLKFLFCAVVSYSENRPSCVYLFDKDCSEISSIMPQKSIDDASIVYEARKAKYQF